MSYYYGECPDCGADLVCLECEAEVDFPTIADKIYPLLKTHLEGKVTKTVIDKLFNDLVNLLQ